MITISDAIKFWLHALLIPAPTMEDRIVNALHKIDATLAKAMAPPSTMQLEAIQAIQDIIHSYPTPPGVPHTKNPSTNQRCNTMADLWLKPTNSPTTLPGVLPTNKPSYTLPAP